MTKQDTWKKRPTVERYWRYKDEMVAKFSELGLFTLPDHIKMIRFIMKMPQSWSEKKKKTMDNKPHKQKPDLDNMLKGVQDCMCAEDEHIWRIANLEKKWGRNGYIIIVV